MLRELILGVDGENMGGGSKNTLYNKTFSYDIPLTISDEDVILIISKFWCLLPKESLLILMNIRIIKKGLFMLRRVTLNLLVKNNRIVFDNKLKRSCS